MPFRNTYAPQPLVLEAPFLLLFKGLPGSEVSTPNSCFKLSTENGFSSADSQLSSRIQKAREALFPTSNKKMEILVAFHDRKLIALEMLLKRAVSHLTLHSDKCLLNVIKVITVINTIQLPTLL